MTAPQIPNLLGKLKTTRHTRSGGPRGPKHSSESRDEIIRGTDLDASGSRLSAAEQGYLDDPFVRAFSAAQDGVRRMPIINRGTYLRTRAIDVLIDEFLRVNSGSDLKQIISLGAGTDTRVFRLILQKPDIIHSLHYYELDFVDTTVQKVRLIERSPFVLSLLRDRASQVACGSGNGLSIESEKGLLLSPFYSIHGIDIRMLGESINSTVLPSLSPTAPTLILSECCLTYIPEPVNSNILRNFVDHLIPFPAHLCIILYEPLHPNDPFGRTMASNLAVRGIEMPSLHATPTIKAHMQRLAEIGFREGQGGSAVKDIWELWVEKGEKNRLKELEMVDEEEEWMLLSAHYGLIWAERARSTSFTTATFKIA